jgi:transposase
MTFSPLALSELFKKRIDPLTFSLLNGSNRIINLFLLGATLSVCLFSQPYEQKLHQYIAEMGGTLRSGTDVYFIISPEDMVVASNAVIVRPLLLEMLWANDIFIRPGHFQYSKRPTQNAIDPATRRLQISIASKCGQSYESIANRYHVSNREISEVKKEIDTGKRFPLPKRVGRPSVMTAEIIGDVRNMTIENPLLGSQKLVRNLQEKYDMKISRQTICSLRNHLRFRWTKARNCPLITPPQILKRLSFCREGLEGTIDWTRDVMISDESRFGLFDDSRSMWVQRGVYSEHTFHPVPKHNTSIMVWGAIGKEYKSRMIIVEGTLNAERYQNMLRDNGIIDDMVAHIALGERQGFFQQDGAPAHRAKSTTKLFQPQIPLILNWPPNSPDLSPIENVWGILKSRVTSREPKNVTDLRKIILEEWNNLDQDSIDRLMDTMPERFSMCIAVDGKFIGHLVRKMSHRQEIEPSEISVERLEKSKMEICKIETPHVGTIVTLTAQPGILHEDLNNPAIMWVEMSDIPRHEPTAPHQIKPARIGMMLLDEERSMIRTTPFTFKPEVHAANGRFLEEAPVTLKETRKVHLYLRLVAVEAREPEPMECDIQDENKQLDQAIFDIMQGDE